MEKQRGVKITNIDKQNTNSITDLREILIDCVKTCLKDDDSITIEQQVDTYLLNKKLKIK